MKKASSKLRIIFAGTPDFAAHHLKALIQDSYNIVAVYTQPDRPAGRGKKVKPSPVKELALENNLVVFQPQSLKDIEAQKQLSAIYADLMIVVAYGLLLPQTVLDIPRYGCINVHGSLLPRWRGAAPIQRAIAAGDTKTGITIMQMDKGLDTGDMLLMSDCDITNEDTSASLHDKLMLIGADALRATLRSIENKKVVSKAQDNNLASYAEKITKEEARICWDESSTKIETKIRAYNPFPVAYTFYKGLRIKVYEAEVVSLPKKYPPGEIISLGIEGVLVGCGEDGLLLKTCQIPNKKRMSVADIINGNKDLFTVGACFEINDFE